jgi:chemotaxis protein methyltransferase CheR
MIDTISDEELTSLTHAILKRHGIDFTGYEPKSLKRRVIRAISTLNLSSVHELWMMVLKDPAFIHTFMNQISVGLTSLFRDPIMWKHLKRELNTHYKNKPLSVWHAGCSTGEEVLSLGILLRELNMTANVHALATDISVEAIDLAKKASYHKVKMAEFENNFAEYNHFAKVDKYATRDGNYCVFDTTLLNHVTFKYHNLINDPFTGKYDIIFCRNVMIYFDTAAKVALMEKFYSVLKPGGLFIVGFFDAINPLVDTNKFAFRDADAKVYQALPAPSTVETQPIVAMK